MNEENQNAAAEQAGAQFSIQRIYTKDVSFETPNSPAIFQKEWTPEVKLDLDTRSNKLEEGVFEVVLALTVTASIGEETAFLCEIQQAGIFTIGEVEEVQLAHMLGAFCPNVLFPYAREAKPRVIKAVRALAPKPKPSDIPAPIAITFLTAPPSCIPIKSSLLYTLNERPQCKRSANCLAKSLEVDDTEIAVGKPIAISFAKVGPESTARGTSSPSSCTATSCSKRPVFGSKPLVAHATSAPSDNQGLIFCNVPERQI